MKYRRSKGILCRTGGIPPPERCRSSERSPASSGERHRYRSLFIQARGALKKELLQHLRRTRVMRRSRHHTQQTDNHGRILDTVSRQPPSFQNKQVIRKIWISRRLKHSRVTAAEESSRHLSWAASHETQCASVACSRSAGRGNSASQCPRSTRNPCGRRRP
jgi:hypothetical protein